MHSSPFSNLLFVGVARKTNSQLKFKATSSKGLSFGDLAACNKTLGGDEARDESSEKKGFFMDEKGRKWLVTKQSPWVYILVVQKDYPIAQLHHCMKDLILGWGATTSFSMEQVRTKKELRTELCARIFSQWGSAIQGAAAEVEDCRDDSETLRQESETNIRKHGHKFHSEAWELVEVTKGKPKKPKRPLSSGCHAPGILETLFSCGRVTANE